MRSGTILVKPLGQTAETGGGFCDGDDENGPDELHYAAENWSLV